MATFHENLVQSFHNFRDKYLKANGNFFKFSYDATTKKYGFTINGTFHPFKVVQASKTVTAGTSAQTVTPDSGYDGVASVTVNPQVHSGTYAPTSFGTSLDMGASHNYRYVNTKNIPHRMGGIWCQIYYSSYKSVVRWTVYGLGGFTGSSTLKGQVPLADGDNSVTVGGITLKVNYSTSTKKVSYNNTTITNNTGVTLKVYPGFMFPFASDGYMSPQAGGPEQVANNSSISCYDIAPSISSMASIDSSEEAHKIVVLVFTFEKVI